MVRSHNIVASQTSHADLRQLALAPCLRRPHKFKAVYAVTLHGELLRTDLRIINTGKEAFDFTAALHTYIEVLDIKKASVKGLKDLEYLDKVMQMTAYFVWTDSCTAILLLICQASLICQTKYLAPLLPQHLVKQMHGMHLHSRHTVGDFESSMFQVKDPNNPTKQKEDRELIKFTGPADSVYLKARDYVELDVGTGKFRAAHCKLQLCLSEKWP